MTARLARGTGGPDWMIETVRRRPARYSTERCEHILRIR